MRQIEEFATLVSAEEMLAPMEPATEASGRLQEIREERARLRPEEERRAEEQQVLLDARCAAELGALEERYRELTAAERALDGQEQHLRMIVMDEIGAARCWCTFAIPRKSASAVVSAESVLEGKLYLKASFTFSPACFKSPATFSAVPSPSR